MRNEILRKEQTIIDYYCFPTKTGDLSVFLDLEQYTDIREEGHYLRTQREVMKAKELGKLLLFDSQNKCFINEFGERIDIEGKVIFPRSTIAESEKLMRYIEEAKGKSITSSSDYKKTELWFKKIKPKREYELVTMMDLEKNLSKYEKKLGKFFFVKTVQKGFSGICMILEISFENKNKYLMDSHFHSLNMTIRNPETKLLVSKKVDIISDEYGKREWRAFVVNNQLWSLSRCSDVSVEIEEYVHEEIESQIKLFKGKVPASYVVDFFEYKENDKTVFDIVEFNPIIASGIFADNQIVF